MRAYYNEFDAYAAAWLRNLIAAGLIPDGDVDERSIVDVRPGDLAGYTQCHFFAGIGGWPLALRLAGWPDDRPVWTGSCPCQPLSSAGLRQGHADERHLWPAFFRLIAERRPSSVFGEQVASKDGREWFAAVRTDLEGLGYAVGGADLCAAGIGAPHIRQRLFWVANAASGRCKDPRLLGYSAGRARTVGHGDTRQLEHANRTGWDEGQPAAPADGHRGPAGSDGSACGVGDTPGQGPQRQPDRGHDVYGSGWTAAERADGEPAGPMAAGRDRPRSLEQLWHAADWLLCRDGRWRPVEPGTFPLAHGLPGRVGRLRAYGNAINPELGVEFIAAFLEAKAGLTLPQPANQDVRQPKKESA